MVHEELQEMLTAHALSALDNADRRALEGHLATCAACRSELDEWQSIASTLAFAAPAVEPTPEVRQRLLAQIASDDVINDQRQQAEPASVLRFSTPRRNIWAALGSLGTVAAGIIVVALLISVIVLWRENRATQTKIAQLQSEIQMAEQQRDRQREMMKILATPGAKVSALAGTKVAEGASATIAYDKTGQTIMLASGLPGAPAGKAYQLWFIVGNEKLPGGVFTPDSAGNANLKDKIPPQALAGSVFAVTLEAASGAKSPTGDIFLLSGL